MKPHASASGNQTFGVVMAHMQTCCRLYAKVRIGRGLHARRNAAGSWGLERLDMNSGITKRSIVINGHKTSVSIEDQFWSALKEIAAERQLTLSALVAIIDHDRGDLHNLSSALRTFVLARYRSAPASVGSQQRVPGNEDERPATP
jgi:predicted DNA-binding ribbon-helix-helix protein